MTILFRFLCHVCLVALCACCVVLLDASPARAGDAEESRSTSRRLLIDGEVLNAETGESVKTFRVIPGVRYNSGRAGRDSVAVWQPHMIREMKDGDFEWPRTRGYDEMRFRVEADGYRPATTTWLGKGGPHLRMKIHLRPDLGIEGVVLKPDGSPASDATLAVGLPNRGIRLEGCKIAGQDSKPGRLSDQWRLPKCIQTDRDGNFLLAYETDRAAMLCVVHESGYFEKLFTEFTDEIADRDGRVEIQLQEWCQVDGRVLWKDQPGFGEAIRATVHRNEPYPGLIAAYSKTIADSKGHYSFKFLPPGHVQLGHEVKAPLVDLKNPQVKTNPKSIPVKLNRPDSIYEYPIQHVDLSPGKIEPVDFGGEGKEIVGRLSGLKSYENISLSIRPPAPDVWGWRQVGGNGANHLQAGYARLQSSSYAPLYFREGLKVAADGSFRIADVMTGSYNLWIRGAAGSMQFTIKTSQQSPHDIGTIQVRPVKK